MNGTPITDYRRPTKYNPGIKNVVIYCAFFAFLFVIVFIIVSSPISTMMISSSRKLFGIMVFVSSISFFSVFSFKTSPSGVCFLPFVFVIAALEKSSGISSPA
jgi:membrane-anchored protein YejM (alkaline phosphatase superfamily)